MKVTTYGTRGSTPIARVEASRYGGNTTCIRVDSPCLPPDMALLVDAGSGLVPASFDLLREGARHIVLLMTHYHHDHTQGFPLAPHTFVKSVPIEVFGPKEHGVGPREMLESLMRAPFFPVDFSKVASHFIFHDMQNLGAQVLVIHPETGPVLMRVDQYERLARGGHEATRDLRVNIEECLVVRMHKTVHPEYTVSYRFEEKPTGRVAVLLTDHENTDTLPSDLREHLHEADLLIQDAQYTRRQYDHATAGYGHGTGDYTARVMKECDVLRLAQTHHDPMANDGDVDLIVEEARTWLLENGAPELGDRVFACADYQEIQV